MDKPQLLASSNPSTWLKILVISLMGLGVFFRFVKMQILGISAYYHDSAAAIVMDGEIVAFSQKERFSGKKHDAKFPKNAIAPFIYTLF